MIKRALFGQLFAEIELVEDGRLSGEVGKEFVLEVLEELLVKADRTLIP